MIKLTFWLGRLPDLSRAMFQTYWVKNHAPLVAKHRGTLRMCNHVQFHSGEAVMSDGIRAIRNAPEMYDCVAELWWDSLDDVLTDPSPERQVTWYGAARRRTQFIDLPRSLPFFGEENVIFG